MKSVLRYVLKNGLRDRLYIGLFLTLISSFAISIFLGDTMMVEKKETALAYIAGTSRVILCCGMILFVCLTTSRSFESKEIEFILSKPISREHFIIGYLLGFYLASLVILLPLSLSIIAIFNFDKVGFLMWAVSLSIETLLVINVALLSSLILKNSFSAILATLGFYVIARMMGLFVLAIELPKNIDAVKSRILPTTLKFLSVVFPRLDLYSQTSWLIYEVNEYKSLQIIIWQSLIYIPLLVFMSFHDFKKKQF